MNRLAGVLLCGFGACAAWCDVVDANGRVMWRSDVAEGSYADAANWTGGVTPMDAGKYGIVSFQNRDVTLTVPAEGLAESSGTVFLGTGDGVHVLTIDTRGTWWEKRGVVSAQHWWGTPFAMNLGGSHVFNFENAPTSANTSFYWRFDDALFTWRSTGTTKQEFDLRSGTFSFGNNLYYGSTGGTVDFFIHPEASLNAPGTFVQRGNNTTRTTFLGGRHRVNGIVLKDTNSGPGRTWLVLTNDAYLASSGGMDLGARGSTPGDGRSTGVVELYGTSRLDVTNAVVLGAGSTQPKLVDFRNEGEVWVRDSATFYANAAVVMGSTQCSTGLVTVADSGTFTTRPKGDSVRLGVSSNAVGRIVVQDDGTFTCGGVLSLAYSGVKAKGYITLKDRAQASCGTFNGTWLQMGRSGDGATARLEILDDATMRLGYGSSVEMTMGNGTSRAEVALDGNGRLLGSASSFITNRSEHAGYTSLSIAGNALVSLKSIHGGAPGTGEPVMAFAADGGTLALSTATPNAPYLSGCVATLGARGLTLDASVADMEIDQAFTAAEGAAGAAVRKTGLGALVVRRNSSHPKTVVSEGSLCFAGGATRFGDVLEVAKGTRLALRDASAAIEADSLSFAGELNVDLPADLAVDAAHPVLRLVTPLTDEQFARIVVANPATGRNYAWALSDDGTELSVSVTEATAGALAWTGAAGAEWADAANWDPAAVPTHNDVATVARGAEIAVGAAASVGTLAVTAADAVTVSGEGPLYVGAGVEVAADGAAELAVPLRKTGGAVAKTGPGTLTVSGGNDRAMFAGWRLDGGTTAFASAAALGADTDLEDALALSNCTFRYAGEAATVVRPWRLNGEFPCIFDVAGDLTFDQFRISFAQGDAAIVKTGAGALTLNVPAGTTTLSTYKSAVRGGNKDVAGTFAPVRGETSGWDGAGQLTVLDGALTIRGEGKALSSVAQTHHALLGGSGWSPSVPAELRLKDVTFTQGSGSGFHMLMDGEARADAPASKLLLEDADMTCNGLYVGHSRSGSGEKTRPVLSITNGSLNATWSLEIPRDVNFAPIVRVGRGGTLKRESVTPAGGLTFNHALDARFEDGGLLKVTSPQNLFFGWNTTGVVVFARGGGMVVNRFLAQNGDRAAVCAFDGGFAEFTLDGGVSCADKPAKTCFRADAGGCELRVGAGVEHALAVSLQGEGVFTKTGAGTLVLTNDLSVKISNNLPVYTPKGTQTLLVANAGGVVVAEGALRCMAGTTDANSRFSGTGVLSGDFTTLSLDVEPGAADALTLDGVTAERVVVDFGRADDDPVRSGTTAAVAKVATAEEFAAMAWKGVHAGANVSATFSRDAETGLVTATLRRGGMAVIIR